MRDREQIYELCAERYARFCTFWQSAPDTEQLEYIQSIILYEWDSFDRVVNFEKRAACQDNIEQFVLMRMAQYLSFSHQVLKSLLADFKRAHEEGRNLISEKYARMMSYTDVVQYERDIKANLKYVSPVKEELICSIRAIYQDSCERCNDMVQTQLHARPYVSQAKNISALDYFTSEIASWSYRSLRLFMQDLKALPQRNYVEEHYLNLAVLAGGKRI